MQKNKLRRKTNIQTVLLLVKILIALIRSLWFALSLFATCHLVIQLIWGRESKALNYCFFYFLKIILLTGFSFYLIKFLKNKYAIKPSDSLTKIKETIITILLGMFFFIFLALSIILYYFTTIRG